MNYTKEDMENFASYAIKHEDLFYHTDLLKMWDKENRTASRESRQLSAVPSEEKLSLNDLDGKTLSVKFTVKKGKLKVYPEEFDLE